MDYGRKICIGSSPFSHIYISHMLQNVTKVHRSSNLLEDILFLGKNHTEYVGSYLFSQKHSIKEPKKDQGKIKHNRFLVYEPKRLNVHITAHGDLTTVYFAIPLDVYEYFLRVKHQAEIRNGRVIINHLI